MKALLFYDELYLGTTFIEHLKPEIQYPVSKELSVMRGFNEPFPLSKGPNMITMVFRLEDYGREYAVYNLHGFN